MTGDWHVRDDDLVAWVEGSAAPAVAPSIEQHLTACPACRLRVPAANGGRGGPDLDRVWVGIADRVEPQSPPVLMRVLRSAGLRDADGVVLGTAQSFTASWIASIAAVVGLTALAAMVQAERMLMTYLLLAPLIPMAGVAAAYGEEVDPTFELAISSPYSQLRLLLLRTFAVLVAAVPATILAGLAISPWWVSLAWLGPGIAFVVLVLAAATYVPPKYAAGAIATAWLVATLVAALSGHELDLVGPLATLLSIGAAGGAGLVLAARRHELSTDWSIG